VYDARGFLEKNRDNLSLNLIECMKNSNIQLVAELFAAERTESGSISRFAFSIQFTLFFNNFDCFEISRSSSNILAKPSIPYRPKSVELKRPRESLTQKKAKSLKKRM
jgi:hypothetical protein